MGQAHNSNSRLEHVQDGWRQQAWARPATDGWGVDGQMPLICSHLKKWPSDNLGTGELRFSTILFNFLTALLSWDSALVSCVYSWLALATGSSRKESVLWCYDLYQPNLWSYFGWKGVLRDQINEYTSTCMLHVLHNANKQERIEACWI